MKSMICCVLLCIMASGHCVPPSTEVLAAMKPLELMPTSGTIAGTVRTVYHQKATLAPEAAAAVKKAGAIAEEVKNSVLVSEETASAEDWLCSTTLYTNISDEDPNTSTLLDSQTIVKCGNTIAHKMISGNQVVYSVCAAADIGQLPLHPRTAGRALQLYMGIADARTAIVGSLANGNWTETKRNGGKTLRVMASAATGTGGAAALDFDLDENGRLSSFRLYQVPPNEEPVLTKELSLVYAPGGDVLPASFTADAYTRDEAGRFVPYSTVTVNITSRAARSAKLPSIESFIKEGAPKMVNDLRVGHRVPVDAVRF